MRRALRVLGTVTAVMLAAGVVACGSKEPLELSKVDSGSKQEIAVGEELTISLEANPTTGYRWAIDGTLPGQLEQVGEAVYTAGSTAIGAGGTEVWTFKGKSAGTATLTLKYWRSFEPDVDPIEIFTVDVTVK